MGGFTLESSLHDASEISTKAEKSSINSDFIEFINVVFLVLGYINV